MLIIASRVAFLHAPNYASPSYICITFSSCFLISFFQILHFWPNARLESPEDFFLHHKLIIIFSIRESTFKQGDYLRVFSCFSFSLPPISLSHTFWPQQEFLRLKAKSTQLFQVLLHTKKFVYFANDMGKFRVTKVTRTGGKKMFVSMKGVSWNF